jgi:diaminopimelate epimerase
MIIPFSKYHGAGNDFIMIDNRRNKINLNEEQISFLCNRHLGIGADGLIYLLKDDKYDFRMQYFNADGKEGTMCGNGGRCITGFAYHLGIFKEQVTFIAIDGKHQGKIIADNKIELKVEISLKDVVVNQQPEDYYFLDTGSPHYVRFVDDLEKADVLSEGKKIRWDAKFQPGGTNVNFAEIKSEFIVVETFERGVENITLSCGTGVTAVAIAASMKLKSDKTHFDLKAAGGELNISFARKKNHFSDIQLTGPVVKVFEGKISL